MQIAVIGGGPGGLYFSALAKQLGPHHEITVWERNAPDDTFGFGVVFSDETLGGIEHADQAVYAAMQREFARWDDIDVHYRGEVITSGGHGFAAMSRKRLLEILQQRCRELGVTMHFLTEAPDVEELVAHPRPRAGLPTGSTPRSAGATPTPSARPSTCGSASTCGWAPTKVFDAFNFHILETPHGVMQVHGYPFDDNGLDVHRRDARGRLARSRIRRLRGPRVAPGRLRREVHRAGQGALRRHARRPRGDGQQLPLDLVHDRSATSSWRHGNVVMLGDAAHTAHFSIGSGTKLAMEDALALAACLHEHDTAGRGAGRLRGRAQAGRAVDAARGPGQPGVVREPRAVRPPGPGPVRLQHHDPQPSRHPRQPPGARPRVRGGHRRLVRRADRWRAPLGAPPMFQPFRLGELELPNRIVVSPMDMYVARATACPTTSTSPTSAARRSEAPGWS